MRAVDTGDAQDYVVPTDVPWTLGWSVCPYSGSWSNNCDNKETGSLTVEFELEGASYLAGLTLTSAAVLALLSMQ